MTTRPPNRPRVGTTDDALELARHLGIPVHGNTIRRWCATGHIRAWKVSPKRWAIDMDALQAQLAGEAR